MKEFNLLINAEDVLGHINPEIYGHFSEHLGHCIYEGIYVGEDSKIPNIHGIRKDVVDALKAIRVPVLRWPGGCFADEYHWQDGIGKKTDRKKMINTNWGGLVEDNSFGTHEFMELCELIGCEPYITGNVGSGNVREMTEWIEYMTFDGISPMTELRRENGQNTPWKLKYFGIGNENWGGGGTMRAEYYADLYRQYQTFCKNYSGNELWKIACGPSADDYHWTEVMMQQLQKEHTKGIALHYYCVPDWNAKGSAAEFTEDEYYTLLSYANYMETLVTRHSEIMNRYDPEHTIGLVVDEWGCWYEVEPGTNPGFLYQQNTMRDAIVAALNLNIFNRHSKRVIMANIAQVVNVLQAVILTENEKMILTPTYHVFDLYKEHQGGDAVYCYHPNITLYDGTNDHNVPMLSSSASIKNDVMTITLANCSLHEEAELHGQIYGFHGTLGSARILTNEVHAHNTFDSPDTVHIEPYTVEYKDNHLHVSLSPCSVVEITLH